MPAPVLFAAITAAAVVLSLLARERDRLPGDLWLTREIQELPGSLEGPAGALRAVTSTGTVLGLGMLLVVALLAARKWWLALQAAVTLALLPLLQASIKDLVDRPRPDPALVDLRDSFTSTSFPSGHVMSGTVLFALIALAAWQLPVPGGVRRALAWGCGIVAALNGLANIYIGVHWPSDVLGGYLWAGVLLAGVRLGMANTRGFVGRGN